LSSQRAEQLIVISLFVFMGSVVGNHLVTQGKGTKEKKHLGTHVVGGFLSMFFAGLLAEAAPELGALLAISLASYAFFHYGLPAINKPFQEKERTAKGVKGATGPKPPGKGPEIEVLPGLGFEVDNSINSQSSPMAV